MTTRRTFVKHPYHGRRRIVSIRIWHNSNNLYDDNTWVEIGRQDAEGKVGSNCYYGFGEEIANMIDRALDFGNSERITWRHIYTYSNGVSANYRIDGGKR